MGEEAKGFLKTTMVDLNREVKKLLNKRYY